jgi:hypothetical protein
LYADRVLGCDLAGNKKRLRDENQENARSKARLVEQVFFLRTSGPRATLLR